MIVRDPLYGRREIRDPASLELLESPSLRRLAGICQSGYARVHFTGAQHTRLEHSLGVYLLLERFGAPREERLAGLLHDASHTVFSHAVDYAMAEESGERQDFQDRAQREYVLASEIPVVLARHGLDAISLLDEENFPLLERPLPDLCADRIDYLLRFALHAGVVERSEARDHLEALRVMENRWVFRDYTSAFEFARLFSFVNNTHLSGFFTAVMFRTVGDALKYAMRIGAVSREELFATDEQVLNMMRQLAEKDEKMAILWRRMNKQSPVLPDFSENPETRAHLKSRAVDPLCLHHGEPVRLSRLDPEWGERVERELAPRSYGLRFA